MKIELTKEEALVLSDWLHKHSGKAEYFDDIAEQHVLWRIEAQLDKELVEPFFEDDSGVLAQAREAVKKVIERFERFRTRGVTNGDF